MASFISSQTMHDEKEPYKFPQIYDFPPMFTKQVNDRTWHAQLRYWSDIVLGYCEHNDIFILGTNDSSSNGIFHNEKIKRTVRQETIKEIFKYMVSHEQADWLVNEDHGSESIVVYFKKPEQWAAFIKEYADKAGLDAGTVVTAYELTEGEDTINEPFHGLPEPMLERALNVLKEQNEIIQMKDADDSKIVGIKFI